MHPSRSSFHFAVFVALAIALSGCGTPAPAKIAFTSGYMHFEGAHPEPAAAYNIFVMNADGSGRLNLTFNSAHDINPVWSPDGKKIAFLRDFQICVMDSDGSNLENLTNGAAMNLGPVWSPDGSKIAYTSMTCKFVDILTPEHGAFKLVNADGSSPMGLTTSESDYLPTWSPDGSKMAFQSKRDGNFEIYVMNADGSKQVNLTNRSEDDELPQWSPTGAEIAFCRTGSRGTDIFVMTADGTGQENLTHNPAQHVRSIAWSPDGSRIAFASYLGEGLLEVFVMNADGSAQVKLTSGMSPVWSPDGKKIAFESERDGHSEIYVMDADGKNTVRLTKGDRFSSAPAWRP